MSRKEKFAYLLAIRLRYHRATRKGKRLILDEFCTICGYNRKYAIRRLNRSSNRVKSRPGRKSRYTSPKFLNVLVRLWKATDFMCSARFKATIPLWLPSYEESFGTLPMDIRELILSISRATLDRVLHPLLAQYGKGLCGTKPGTMLRNEIPIRTDNWDITQPGFMEADTVAHCGNSLAGNFTWSLLMTDIHTGWTECRAVWNKGSYDVREQIKDIKDKLKTIFKLILVTQNPRNRI